MENKIKKQDNLYWIRRSKNKNVSNWEEADKLEKELKKEYLNTYKKLEKEFLAFSNKFGINGQLTYSQKRVIALMGELKPHIEKLYESENKKISDVLSYIYKDNYFKMMYELSVGTNVGVYFVKPEEGAIKTAIKFPWSGESFSDRIYNDKVKLINTLKQEITGSLIRGETPAKTIKEIANRLNISNRNASVLVQTETAAVINSSDKKAYNDFGFEEYQFVSTLDDRTSNICRELDMQVFDLENMTSGLNAPPMHPRCRSTTVPYFDNNFGKRIARNIKTGQAEYVRSDMQYKEWFNKFS